METYEKKQRLERERVVETTESKEDELNEEAKAAALRERAEYLVKEVKSSTQQIQHIMLHMQQVLSALHALRTKLELTHASDPSSINEDKKQVEKFKNKIQEYKAELRLMKEDLIAALHTKEDSSETSSRTKKTKKEATEMVEKIMRELDIQE